jgi:polyhydroxyalkanoate synthesis regulator phasin
LFKNLQTEFRESTRQEAEKIKGEIENTIQQEELARKTEFEKVRQETMTKEKIFANE